VIAIAIFGGIGAFLGDARGVPFGLFGAFLWVIVLLVSFMFGLLYYAQFLLSLRGNEGWSEGLRLLWRHYLLQGQFYLQALSQPKPQGRARRVRLEPPPPDPNRLPASFKLLNAGMVKSHQALALSRGAAFSRAAGPGFVVLNKGESISHVIDLRPYVRAQPVKANTRDGITLETTVRVVFRVQQSPADHADSKLPYPYDREAIFQVSYAHRIDAGDKLLAWTEQLAPKAAALLVTELSTYTLDDLYQVANPDAAPVEEIRQRVLQQLALDAQPLGITVMAVSMGHFSLPPAVVEQRIRTWQSRWDRDVQVQHAVNQGEAVRRLKKARARVQIEIIERITQSIEAMRRTEDANLTEIVMLRMIEVLEEAMSDGSVKGMIPEQIMANLVMETSSQMRNWLGKPQEDQSA
jgi:regulator of protease activity HflC (stomatin/prohibitin superfamily)